MHYRNAVILLHWHSQWHASPNISATQPEFKDIDHMRSLLQPYESDNIETVAVGSYVGNVRNEGWKYLEPIGHMNEAGKVRHVERRRC